ncbi:MAG: thermonuclease family protein, partial [Pseudomonadota bacterium]
MGELNVGRLARGVALAAGTLLASAASAETVSGVPRVVDGDSLAFGAVAVRLHGIDAPEAAQHCGSTACGAMATAALRQLAAGGVTCALRERDRYGRFIG